ncbi:unnamed protein product, partial [Lampetra fluviatilis]
AMTLGEKGRGQNSVLTKSLTGTRRGLAGDSPSEDRGPTEVSQRCQIRRLPPRRRVAKYGTKLGRSQTESTGRGLEGFVQPVACHEKGAADETWLRIARKRKPFTYPRIHWPSIGARLLSDIAGHAASVRSRGEEEAVAPASGPSLPRGGRCHRYSPSSSSPLSPSFVCRGGGGSRGIEETSEALRGEARSSSFKFPPESACAAKRRTSCPAALSRRLRARNTTRGVRGAALGGGGTGGGGGPQLRLSR